MRQYRKRLGLFNVFDSEHLLNYRHIRLKLMNISLHLQIFFFRVVCHAIAFRFFVKRGYVPQGVIDILQSQRNE